MRASQLSDEQQDAKKDDKSRASECRARACSLLCRVKPRLSKAAGIDWNILGLINSELIEPTLIILQRYKITNEKIYTLLSKNDTMLAFPVRALTGIQPRHRRPLRALRASSHGVAAPSWRSEHPATALQPPHGAPSIQPQHRHPRGAPSIQPQHRRPLVALRKRILPAGRIKTLSLKKFSQKAP